MENEIKDELLQIRESLAALRVRLAGLGEPLAPDMLDTEWALLAIEGEALALATQAQGRRSSTLRQRSQGALVRGMATWRRAQSPI